MLLPLGRAPAWQGFRFEREFKGGLKQPVCVHAAFPLVLGTRPRSSNQCGVPPTSAAHGAGPWSEAVSCSWMCDSTGKTGGV